MQVTTLYRQIEEDTEPKINLVVRAYDKIIELLNEAAEKMENKDYEAKGQILSRAIDIITELMAALNFKEGQQIAIGLHKVYLFALNHIMEANKNNDSKALRQIANIFNDINEAWREVARRYFQKANKGKEIGAYVRI